MNFNPLEISVTEAASDIAILKKNGHAIWIIDVREQWEWDLVALPHSVHVPLASLVVQVFDIPPDACIFTLCHHGLRSLKAALWFRNQGFVNAKSIKGGIEEWACQVDQKLKRY